MRIFLHFCAVLFLCSVTCAQDFDTGMEISEFRIPDYDEQGVLRARLFGRHAKMLEGGEVEITQLKIEMYKDGQVVTTVFSPHCFFNMDTRQAHSEGRVLIESGWMTIAGRGFTWSAEAGRFEVLHDSKVIVKPSARAEQRELEL